jgi:hypothetical protein
LKDLDLDLLLPEEYEAITKANYGHPESRLILQLFLQLNYFWHITRFMQGRCRSIKDVDWIKLEVTTKCLIGRTLEKLLKGVEVTAWVEPPKPTKTKK